MGKRRTIYRCSDCGAVAPQWAGRCAACGAWNALLEEFEEVRSPSGPGTGGRPAVRPVPITEFDTRGYVARSTSVGELDRVLGGGLVPGSVTLLGGEPGIGKSTLLLAVVAGMARAGHQCLYVSGEESGHQVHARAERLGALHSSLHLLPETFLPDLLDGVSSVAPDVVVVDSIQTMVDPELASAPGSVTQVRECAHRLVREAKTRGVAIVLVGHVTKDGGLAGPRVLEHVVDTVLAFEGDRHHALRLLRAVKHRFGSTSELGVFEMTDGGLVGVPDPSGLFLADRCPGVAGSAVVPTIEGHRPLLIEVQALVAPAASAANARRSAHGVDHGRLAMLLAVLERRVGLRLAGADVYASAVGGVRLTEPGADLGVCLAIASALNDRPLPEGLAACGEVGLGGELRQVAQTPRRLAEAARLGFSRVVVPASAPNGCHDIDVQRVATIHDAIALAVQP
jgi:DNA repair protein RadA/Sms